MKPAELVTTVVSVPVIAALLVSALSAPVEMPSPPQAAYEAPAAFAQNVAEEIVVVAKRVALSPAT